jgi:hypothetical protein
MGNKVSAVHGVKSDHFYDQGNAINEIWVGDVEIVSRLPFGDSDQEQAGWPAGGVPKIPWHHFIIPMHKRDEVGNMSGRDIFLNNQYRQCTCEGWLPKNGYLEMYTGIDPHAAELIAMLSFSFAGALAFVYLGQVSSAFTIFKSSCSVSKWLSDRGMDGTELKRQSLYRFRSSLLRAAMLLPLLALVVGLALPALAAATQKRNAAAFIISRIVWYIAGGFSGLLIAPLLNIYLTMRQESWPGDIQMDLRDLASSGSSVGLEHVEHAAK